MLRTASGSAKLFSNRCQASCSWIKLITFQCQLWYNILIDHHWNYVIELYWNTTLGCSHKFEVWFQILYTWALRPCRFGMIWNDSWSLWWASQVSWDPSSESYDLATPRMLQPSSPLSLWRMLMLLFQKFFRFHCKYINVCIGPCLYSGPSCPHPSCLQPSYPHPRCVPSLENAIKEVDSAYDSCNEAWAQGEADKFRSVKFLTQFVVLGWWCSGFVNKIHQNKRKNFLFYMDAIYWSSMDHLWGLWTWQRLACRKPLSRANLNHCTCSEYIQS